MRCLVLSGGAAKGAFSVGALQHILGEKQVHYDAFCGVSVGAINASFLAMFKRGEEKLAIRNLTDLWLGLNNASIYKRWFPFGGLHSIWKRSFFDSSPLHNLLRKHIQLDRIRTSGKHVSVGAVSLSSGKYTIFDQAHDHFIEAVTASSSFPGMLSPIEFDGQLWTDGGVKEISPIRKAIDLGADIIDLIITSPTKRIKKFIANPTTVDILKRSIDLSTDKIMANDIEMAEMYNRLAVAGLSNKKFVRINIIRPETNLIEDLLDFRPHKIREMMEIGYQTAVANFRG